MPLSQQTMFNMMSNTHKVSGGVSGDAWRANSALNHHGLKEANDTQLWSLWENGETFEVRDAARIEVLSRGQKTIEFHLSRSSDSTEDHQWNALVENYRRDQIRKIARRKAVDDAINLLDGAYGELPFENEIGLGIISHAIAYLNLLAH